MSDPKVVPQSEADIAKTIEKQTEYIEQFKIKEIPACLEGLAEEQI